VLFRSVGAETPAAAFRAVQELEAAPFMGDAWFFRALAALGRDPNRLVETQDGRPLPVAPPAGQAGVFARISLCLTDEGRNVLSGRSDRVALLGIDRWVGGTHVTPDNVWRWDPARRRLLQPA